MFGKPPAKPGVVIAVGPKPFSPLDKGPPPDSGNATDDDAPILAKLDAMQAQLDRIEEALGTKPEGGAEEGMGDEMETPASKPSGRVLPFGG